MLRKYKGYTIIKEDIPKNEIDFFGGEYLVKERDIMFYTLKECKQYIDRLIKNNRLKVIVNDGFGNTIEKNFTNIHCADEYHNKMYRKLFLTNNVNRDNAKHFNLSELKILRLHHEI